MQNFEDEMSSEVWSRYLKSYLGFIELGVGLLVESACGLTVVFRRHAVIDARL